MPTGATPGFAFDKALATITRIHNGKVYYTYLLRRSYRQDGKVKHQTLGNISHLSSDLIQLISRRLRGKLVGDSKSFKIVRNLPNGHVAAAERSSPVAPAQPSASARRKAGSKKTPDGETVQSFQDVLNLLATIKRNRVRVCEEPAVEIDHLTQPTPQQQKILDLLGVSLEL